MKDNNVLISQLDSSQKHINHLALVINLSNLGNAYTQSDNLENIKRIVEAKADINERNVNSKKLLYYINNNMHYDVVGYLVHHCDLDVNAKSKDGLTLLHYAALMGISQSTVSSLIKYKADVNVFNVAKWTPIQVAISIGKASVNMINTLFENKASFNNYDEEGRPWVHYITKKTNASVIKYLVTKHDLSLHVKDELGSRVLYYALYNGAKLSVFKALIEHKADVNAQNIQCWTPLQMVLYQSKSLEFIKALVNNKADVNALDEEGRHLTCYIAQNTNPNIISYILKECQLEIGINHQK